MGTIAADGPKNSCPEPSEAVPGPAASLDASRSRRCRRQRRKLFLFAGTGARGARRGPRDRLPQGGGSNDERGQRSRPPASRSRVSRPSRTSPTTRTCRRSTTKPKWNSSPPTSGPALRRAGGLGLLRRAGAARANGAQPRAWRRRHPLRAAVPEGRGGEDPRVVHRGPERPGRRAARANKDKVTLSAWTAPDASTGTRDRGRGWLATGKKFDEAAFDGVRPGAPVQGPRASPARAVSARQLAVHPPGWRNWQTRST